MRLTQLKIKNIASLKGEHLIDFSAFQNESPLFAITGETGAGKSSILNSIGLVLYGKVYKPGVVQQDLVTLGEKEGQIELLFQANGKTYLAFWRSKVRKPNGEAYATVQSPQRELYVVDGEEFTSPKTIVTTKIEEILNLDFDQFCKCIILNQGEFARFLSSSFTERKEILEKLYSGEMLESLGSRLKQELDLLQKQKNDLDIELGTLNGDGPQGHDLNLEKKRLAHETKIHEEWFGQLESIRDHFHSFDSYHQKFHENKSKIDQIKLTLSDDTTVFNHLLQETQVLTEALSEVQLEQEKKLPHLQELLKAEEGLKHLLEQKLDAQKNTHKYETQKESLFDKHKLLHPRLLKSEEDLKAEESHFKLPLAELKLHQGSFASLFDLLTKEELLQSEAAVKEERLSQLEVQGKDEARELKELSLKKGSFETDKEDLKTLEQKRATLKVELETQNQKLLKLSELKAKSAEIKAELQEKVKLEESTLQELVLHQQEILPIETTLKLQSLFNAVEVCLTHPSVDEDQSCPVCKNDLSLQKIQELRAGLQKNDLTHLKARETQLTRLIVKKEEELLQLQKRGLELKKEDQKKEAEHLSLFSELTPKLPDLTQVEEELKLAQKKVWEQEKIQSDVDRLTLMLTKTREQYGLLKSDLTQKLNLKQGITSEIKLLTSNMLTLLPELSEEVISGLKTEVRKLQKFLDLEVLGEKLKQENAYLKEQLDETQKNLQEFQQILEDLSQKVASLTLRLTSELQGKKASDLIQELHLRLRTKTDELSLKEKESKHQELKLKASQGRLYTHEEQMRDLEMQFVKESHALKELAQLTPTLVHEDSALLLSKLKTMGLDLVSPSELFHPFKDLIRDLVGSFKQKTSALKMLEASVSARLEDWEKKQDRIKLLLLKSQELTQLLDRRLRLYEVLGKDELRTFVLSLVEENLIAQTNDELQKLCQGRYEIIHQSRRMKLTPEFYILDKFREGGLRKVSTLSGGETFMVSLAMALGLAEMTRGKAEIDCLFIDEGFGTLDQESLEDVLDMLKQIQTRGLMVGVISHVKALTDSLPVNLKVTKRQDGTSTVGIQYN